MTYGNPLRRLNPVVATAPARAGEGTILLPGSPRRLWFAASVYLACAGVFLADLFYDIPWASGVFYMPLVCTAVCYRDPRWAWWLAAGAIGMVLLGFVFPVVNFSPLSVVNPALSIAAILATAGLVRIERDTHNRLARETLRVQAASRLKTQILANVSDELRAPVDAIIGFSNTLAPDVGPEKRQVLEHLRSSAERLSMTIENLLDLATVTDRTLRLETLDVGAIVRDAVDAVRHAAAEKHIWLESVTERTVAQATGDAWALRRIVDNLINNALKFTPGSGHVRVATEAAPGHVVIVVEDSGPGIPPGLLCQLGQPFLRASIDGGAPRPGLGNGLALCAKLADAMAGTLTFSSEPGQGTSVRLGLPVG